MEYREQLKDFLKRSKHNLNIIKENNGYETTQLICNFISTLIFIKENKVIKRDKISKYGLSCLIIKNTYPINFKYDLRELVRHLRNACCHYGIEIKDKNQVIDKVWFKDIDNNKKYYCEFEMTINDIERLYEYLLNYI